MTNGNRICDKCGEPWSLCVCPAIAKFFSGLPTWVLPGKDVAAKDTTAAPRPIALRTLQRLAATFLVVMAAQGLMACGKPRDGQNGASGKAGERGLAGENGLNGSDGQQGPTGAAGPAGPTGPQGPIGLSPEACTTTQVVGGVEIRCPDGSSQVIQHGHNGLNGTNGTNGSNGANGADGQNGSNGTNGQNGTPGTLVTPVQLCANYITVYPSSFPEYAFCIGGSLYAVYWNGTQAFNAQIVPGIYMSTSPQGCSFTVLPGCLVQ